MRSSRSTRLVGGLAAGLLLFTAACADPEDTSDGANGQAEPEPAEPQDPEDAAPPTFGIADTELGEILVDADGMTLYMYDPDEQGESTYYEECAEAWPPVVVDSADDIVPGEGMDAGLVGTVERDDGSTQATYNDWPLYLWRQDETAGDVDGQAVGEVWWVVRPDGEPYRGDNGGGGGGY